jgi:CubicO group peptidase (beta-lactamase class C family)
MRKQVTFIALFLLVITSLTAQKRPKTGGTIAFDPAGIFDNYIQTALQQWQTPGLSVVVVKGNEVVFKKAYGVQDINTRAPYTTSTLSTCASTTKAMTAVCMAMLVDEGKIRWDDVVSDILPEFKLADPYTTAEITVKDLFTHNTGLGNADLLWALDYPRSEILRRMQFIPPAYSLRSSYIYQNLMYIVAGEVIKKISGKTWDEFITERIFRPLGMNNTFADYSKISPASSRTTPHFKDPDDNDMIKAISYLTDDNVGAAGGVWSCTDDISKWLRFLNDSARVDGKRLLEAETFAELFKPQALIPASEFYPTMRLTKPHWTSYGLGWFQHDYRGKMVQFHTGSLDGLVAICGMIPADKVAVYVFGNLDHSEIRHALMYKAFDLWSFSDFSYNNDWAADFYKLYKSIADTGKKREAEQVAKRVPDTHPSLTLKEYCGRYTSRIYGDAEVIYRNDSLILQLSGNKFSLLLKHWNYDTFRGWYSYWWMGKSFIEFRLNTEGKVSGFSLDGIEYEMEIQK